MERLFFTRVFLFFLNCKKGVTQEGLDKNGTCIIEEFLFQTQGFSHNQHLKHRDFRQIKTYFLRIYDKEQDGSTHLNS